MGILREQLRFVRSPKATITELADNPRAAAVGFKHVLYLAVLWELAIVLWAFGGAMPTMPAFLKIPEDRYYFYQLIFMIPMFLVVWLLAGSVAYVLSKAIGGNGSYEVILGGFGIAAPISGYFALIPDYIQGILWTTGWVSFDDYQQLTSRGPLLALVVAYMFGYVAAHLALYSTTIYHSQHLSKTESVIVAAISFFASASIFIVVVR